VESIALKELYNMCYTEGMFLIARSHPSSLFQDSKTEIELGLMKVKLCMFSCCIYGRWRKT